MTRFILGRCQCGCNSEIPIITHPRPQRRTGILRRFRKGHYARKGPAKSRCKICKSQFHYEPARSKGIYCSKSCYLEDKEFLRNQSLNARKVQVFNGINLPKLSDERLLELWTLFKNSNSSLASIFKHYGYKRTPPKRLLKILPKGEYEQYCKKNNFKHNGYLGKRGTNYERKAKKELEAEGYLAVRSGASLGPFDLWALGNNELRLIQVKAIKYKSNFTKLQEELRLIQVPAFCSKELWVWLDRRGWTKTKIPAETLN